MGILSRVSNIARSNVNDILEKRKSKGITNDKLVEDMKSDISLLRSRIRALEGYVGNYEIKIADLESDLQDLREYIDSGMGSGAHRAAFNKKKFEIDDLNAKLRDIKLSHDASIALLNKLTDELGAMTTSEGVDTKFDAYYAEALEELNGGDFMDEELEALVAKYE